MGLVEFNYAEAAEYCGLKETTFRKLCKEGKGPKARLDGRSMRFLREHLSDWLDEYKKEAYSTTAGTLNSKRAKGRKKSAPSATATGLLE